MRYVKFFYGFLCHKLAEGKPLEKNQTFFELALKKHNYMSFNRVFEDMKNESIDFHSIVFGPFPTKVTQFELKLSTLTKDKIEKMTVLD